MVEYFQKREGQLAKEGIGALKKSLAAIYYLPFQCGVNLYFRFSGQSIPNRCVLDVGVSKASGLASFWSRPVSRPYMSKEPKKVVGAGLRCGRQRE